MHKFQVGRRKDLNREQLLAQIIRQVVDLYLSETLYLPRQTVQAALVSAGGHQVSFRAAPCPLPCRMAVFESAWHCIRLCLSLFLGVCRAAPNPELRQQQPWVTPLARAAIWLFPNSLLGCFRQLLTHTADRHLNFIIPCCTGITQLDIWGHITLLLALQWLGSSLGKGRCCIITSLSIRS